jgi:magnesium-transporting ATPase (P-type)
MKQDQTCFNPTAKTFSTYVTKKKQFCGKYFTTKSSENLEWVKKKFLSLFFQSQTSSMDEGIRNFKRKKKFSSLFVKKVLDPTIAIFLFYLNSKIMLDLVTVTIASFLKQLLKTFLTKYVICRFYKLVNCLWLKIQFDIN